MAAEQSFWIPNDGTESQSSQKSSQKDPKEEPNKDLEEQRTGFCHCCFPCRPFTIFGPLCICLPETWQNIQDFTHFSLVIGVMAGFVLIGRSVLDLYFLTCIAQEEFFCGREVIMLFFSISVITYIGSIISQYDEQLIAKEAAIKDQKEKLLANYGVLLNDMDSLLSNATESASGLAERSFESKRRDFQRFLERAKLRFTNKLDEDGQMLTQFRQFCINWLKVFQECSIDPVARPLKVVEDNLLMGCMSIREVADMCLEHLRVTEVRFISHQQDKDKKRLQSNRRNLDVIKQQPVRVLAITIGGELIADSNMAGTASFNAMQEKDRNRCTWMKCGSGNGCECKQYGTPEDRFPRTCAFGFGKIICLSKQHTMLIGTFVFGLLVLAADVFDLINDEKHEGLEFTVQVWSEVALVLLLWCVSVLLLNFEDLDKVQKLEREVVELKEQNENVEQQSKKMKDFWSSAQNLTELWLYRTVPRLDLYKEVHSLLEDEDEQDLLKNLKTVNVALGDLEKNMGALELWRNDGGLSADDKKVFGRMVNETCHSGELPSMMEALQDNVIRSPAMKRLKALPTAPNNIYDNEGPPRTSSKDRPLRTSSKDRA